jgi:hypothetical protein
VGIVALPCRLLSPLAALRAADTPQPRAKPNVVFNHADDWGGFALSSPDNDVSRD